MAITFDNIAGGELAEKFRIALAQIGRNILDPNMDPEEARGMTINLKFKPSKAGTIQVDFSVKTKLASFAKSDTTFLIGQDSHTGRIEISEYNNNRPVYQAVTAAPAVPPPQAAEASQTFDPETGEILDPPPQAYQKPIDLRQTI